MSLIGFFRSQLYDRVMGAFLGFVLVGCAACATVATALMTRDPESGRMFFDASWIGSWLFVGSVGFLLYSILTFSTFLVALRRYRADPADLRPYTVGLCLIALMFPLGSLYSMYASARLKADKQSANKAA